MKKNDARLLCLDILALYEKDDDMKEFVDDARKLQAEIGKS